MIANPLRVTVVIPCYKQAHYLGMAIESVLAQTRPADEIIVIDDGSPDRTAEVCRTYPQVRLVRQSNQGVSRARNAGLALASGDLINFLDADDHLLPQALERLSFHYAADPTVGAVYGQYRIIDETGGHRHVHLQDVVTEDHYSWLLNGNFIGCPAVVLFRKDVIVKLGGFDTTVTPAEDYDLYIRLSRDHVITGIDEIVAEYRQHSTSNSGDPRRMVKKTCAVLLKEIRSSSYVPKAGRYARVGANKSLNYYASKSYWQALGRLKEGQLRRGLAELVDLARCCPELLIRQIALHVRGNPTRLP